MVASTQAAFAGVTATGGNTTNDSGGYRIHTFTNSGTFTVTSPGNVDVLVVAGGGGAGGAIVGGSYGPAGGGAGGLVSNVAFAVTNGALSVTVGAGGAGGPAGNNYGTNGFDSIFDTLRAYGGGGGAGNDNVSAYTGRGGGSGGGGSRFAGLGGSATNLQGNAGGRGSDSGPNYGGGAGGGASSVGGDGVTTNGGAGGAGVSSSISGVPVTYATGGNGSKYASSGSTVDGTAGTANTGNGGNGGTTVNASAAMKGGDGGFGIVIVRYLSDYGTWYVSTNGSDASGGTNWATAFLTVSNAVSAARDGDTIFVSNGTYNVAISSPIWLTNAVTLLGVGGPSNTFLRGPYPSIGRVLSVSNANAVVDGFTITNGLTSAGVPNWASGLYLAAGFVRNCVVAGNSLTDGDHAYGGGVYMSGGILSNVVIRGNYARTGHLRVTYGGGMFMSGGLLVDSRIELNQAVGSATGWGGSAYGGGVFMTGGRIWNCLVTSNRVQRTINGGDWNSSWGSGGGLYVGGGSVVHATVADNVCVSNNPSGGVGAGIYEAGGGVTNTIAYFNQVAGVANDFFSGGGTVVYSCAPELTTGAGNLTGDPQFVNRAAGDYRIGGASVCVDAGTNVPGLPVDLGLNARPQDGDSSGSAVADVGCYEFVPGQVLTCNFSTTNSTIGVNFLSNVLFKAVVTGPAGSTNVNYYWWNFGSGTTPQEGATLSNAVNTFGPGIYDISLVISNSLGQVTNAVKAAYIQVTADTTFVATNGGHAFPYNTWSRAASNPAPAFAALVQAFNSGATNGVLWVSNGTYILDAHLNMSYPVRLQSMNGASNTVLKRGTFQNRLLFVNHPAALVDGFTVTNGYLADNPSYGGGIYLGSGTVRNCIITGNGAYAPGAAAGGGGRFSVSGYVSNLIVVGNTAQGGHFNHGYGGGLYVGGGTAMNCRVEGNTARGSMTGWGGYAYGGGLFVAGGQVLNVLATSNRVERRPDQNGTNWNVTYGFGGGIYMSAGSLVNATVADNFAVSNNPSGMIGGGLYQTGGTAANCIIYYNVSNGVPPGPDNYIGSGAIYSCAPELTSGVRNVTAPPQFRILGSGFDYTILRAGSPCRNAGTNQAWMYSGQDLKGNFRIIGNAVDMGAYEAPLAGSLFVVH